LISLLVKPANFIVCAVVRKAEFLLCDLDHKMALISVFTHCVAV